METLQNKFRVEFERTSQNRFRNTNDMQFAFSYNYFVMSELEEFNASKLFDEIIDLNRNERLEPSELTVLNLRLSTHEFSLHSTSISMNTLNPDLVVCLNECKSKHNLTEANLSKKQFLDCPSLVEFLRIKLWNSEKLALEGTRHKYKFEEVSGNEIKFIMIGGDPFNIEIKLNNLMRRPNKFICLNDNIDYKLKHEALELKRLLKNFYTSMYPLKSSFEKTI